MKEKLKELNESTLGKAIIKLIVGIIISLVIFLAIYFSSKKNYQDISNASFACFGTLVGLSFFSYVNQEGLFDAYKYGFTYLFGSFGRLTRIKYGNTYQDYKIYMDNKREEKSDTYYKFTFLVYLGLSIIYLIVAIVFLCMWNDYIRQQNALINLI